MKRSILDPKSRFDFAQEALAWLWMCRTQLERLNQDLREDFRSRQNAARTSLDIQLFLVAGRNLQRHLRRTGDHKLVLSEGNAEALRLLRNLHEHKDDSHLRKHFGEPNPWPQTCPVIEKGRRCSAFEFRQKWPDANPWCIAWTKQGVEIGNSLSLRSFLGELEVLEERLSK